MNEHPLVSVICLCYDQGQFIKDAVNSVLDQEYPNIELIIVDDHSTDVSAEVIRKIVTKNPQIKAIYNSQNLGNCKAFNIGYLASSGEYLIDLAADDLLDPNRISKGLEEFERHDINTGVHYSPVKLIDKTGQIQRISHQETKNGNLYKLLIQKHFISAPSMMIKRKVLEKLNGYDEALTYEDFDFWIRSSRKFEYCSSPEALTSKRILKDSLGNKQYRLFSKHMNSTFLVCQKIYELNKNQSEDRSLRIRIHYEFKQCLKYLKIGLVIQYSILYLKTYFRTFG